MTIFCLLLNAALFAQSQQHRQDTIIFHFTFNHYDIQAADTLQWNILKTKKIDSIHITGYTDTVGTTAYNNILSQKRAAAAAAWLNTQLPTTVTTTTSTTPIPATINTDTPAATVIPITTTAGGESRKETDSASRRAEIIVDYLIPDTPKIAAVPDSVHPDTAQPTAVISLQHINFIVDTPIPTDATRAILPKYVDMLRQYKDRRMEIDGYVNSITPLHGPNDPLFILSVKRARFIYDYLVEAGFDSTRLSYKGMGNASPVNPIPVTKAQMNANMRVEIRVF